MSEYSRPKGIKTMISQGSNSTMFTECCGVAICTWEARCPRCGELVIGYDLPLGERNRVRWNYATRLWIRK